MLVGSPVAQGDYTMGDLIEIVISTSETPPEGSVGVFTGWKKYCFDPDNPDDTTEWVCVCLVDGEECHLFQQDIKKVDNE